MSARPNAILDRSAFPYPDVVAVYEMTEQEFLDWDQQGGLADWVDGRVYHYMSAAEAHQIIVGFLFTLLDGYGAISCAGRVLTGPYAMRTRPGRRWREPDLMFITNDQREQRQAQGMMTGAALVVEVVSPGGRKRDLEDKLDEYAQAGVREYWVVDPRPRRQRVVFFRLEEGDGPPAYREVFASDDGVYESAVLPGFWFRPEWLFEENPNGLARLVEVAGPEAILRLASSPNA